MQTRTGSLLESLTNVFIGWLVGLLSQIVVFPFVGIHVELSTNLKISLIFTFISIGRSYVIRRYYNWKILKKYERENGKAYPGIFND